MSGELMGHTHFLKRGPDNELPSLGALRAGDKEKGGKARIRKSYSFADSSIYILID